MANADFKLFIEDRLRALDPTLDLEAGSPAQVQFIEPILQRLGTDPFETDVDTFLTTRFRQEFPDIYAEDPGVIRDTFVKPLILMLEPFKRELQTIKIGQTFANPELLSDEEADALAANIFESRSSGGFATGVVRVFFAQPTNAQAEMSVRSFTAGGLGYHPASPVSITAEQMVFNRSGSLFYFDVPMRAEAEGAEYNVEPDEISGIEGIYGAVRVTNPRRFKNGAARLSTPSFIAATRESLNERSLVTRRGASSKLNKAFQGEIRAVQVIGARDPEMRRDILTALSPGHSWLSGVVNLYDRLAYVQCRMVDGAETDSPTPGDTLFVYLNSRNFPEVSQGNRVLKFKVEEVVAGPMKETHPFQISFLVRFSGEYPEGLYVPNPAVLEGGFSKKGTVQITSLPNVGPVSLTVPNGEIHVYGHTDIYVRPVLQPVSEVVLEGLFDQAPLVERSTLSTLGEESSDQNVVRDPGFNFEALGIAEGDVLLIEEGDDAGTYVIGKSWSDRLYLRTAPAKSAIGLRYRILKGISVDIFEPKNQKFPFGEYQANDLSTTIGSNILRLSINDLLGFGVKVGDVVRVKTGTDQGDFVIQGFDTALGGKGLIVDRPAVATNSGLVYQVFTKLNGVERPLIRVRELLLLDSSQQSTGITVPPADPVAVLPTCNFTSAVTKGRSLRKTGMVLPALEVFEISGGSVAAPSGDRRYSMGFDEATGTYRSVKFADGTYAEFDFRADAAGKSSYFLATTEVLDGKENFPPVDPKPGESLTIKAGPNKGSYLIKDVHKFKHRTADGKTVWTYFIQIHGEFPYDVLKALSTFLKDMGIPVPGKVGSLGTIEFPKFFVDAFSKIGDALNSALSTSGATSPGEELLQSVVEKVALCEYEWGIPAKGIVRSYFQEPVLFEQRTDLDDRPTALVFKTETGEQVKFHPDPDRYDAHQVLPGRISEVANPADYPRDLSVLDVEQVELGDLSRGSAFSLGVRPGDVLSVHEQVVLHGAKNRMSGVQLVAGSSKIISPNGIFTPDMVGNLVDVAEGPDRGTYSVVSYESPQALHLDHVFSESTPTIQTKGAQATCVKTSDGNLIQVETPVGQGSRSSGPIQPSHVGLWVTIYGADYTRQGSFKITEYRDGWSAKVDAPTDFPSTPTEPYAWVITQGSSSAPKKIGNGTELVGLRPIWMYESTPHSYEILEVAPSSSESKLTVPNVFAGIRQPYRIYRPGVRRVTPTEMSEKQEGHLFYFDTEVISLGSQSSSNLHKGVHLHLEPGTYQSYGYRHVVADPSLTYSMKEAGSIEMPLRILPVGSEDSEDAFISLVGAPLQISYERSDLVQQLQAFLDSGQDRVTTANLLARHFLPSYVSYDASYTGGSAPSVVAKDIISYIENVPVETSIDVSEIQDLISRRGGNPITPTMAIAVTHDWDRKAWAEFGTNEIGGPGAEVPYNGTSRVTYFTPGQDVSGLDPAPAGERVKLTRL